MTSAQDGPGPSAQPGAEIDLAQTLLALHEAGDSETTVERVVEFACSAVACDDAGVMLVHARHRIETEAATSGRVEWAHRIQVDLQEGPGSEADESRAEVCRVTDTRRDTRWPRWGSAMADLGYGSVLSVPLSTASRRYGSLTVYWEPPGAFDDDDVAVASILARHASLALAVSRDIEGLRRAVDARKLIGMAMGIVMERYTVSSERAFDVLRRYSQDRNVKLRDVARQIVEQADGA